MLRFIPMGKEEDEGEKKFQYIPCYGLSLLQSACESKLKYFNTSHVTVYLKAKQAFTLMHCYFNTSHVTVYLIFTFVTYNQLHNFNTSHVTVYPGHCDSTGQIRT